MHFQASFCLHYVKNAFLLSMLNSMRFLAIWLLNMVSHKISDILMGNWDSIFMCGIEQLFTFIFEGSESVE